MTGCDPSPCAMDLDCGKCGGSLRKEHHVLICAGFCRKSFHAKKCFGIPEKEYDVLNNFVNIKFMCDTCINAFEVLRGNQEMILSEIKQYEVEMKKLIEEKSSGIINRMEAVMREFKCENNDSELKIVNASNKNSGEIRTYANTLRLPVIVKPKERTQKVDKTLEDIKKSVNPSSISARVNNIVQLKNDGAISISCSNKQSAVRIEKEILEKLGSNYEVRVSNSRKPKILVVGMNEEINKEDIVLAIKSQNDVNFEELNCVKVYRSFKNPKIFNAIIEMDGKAFEHCLRIGKINIMWDRCSVYESMSVLRCLKCGGFNHKALNCTVGALCYKCGVGDGHIAKNCMEVEIKCINCVKAKKDLNLKDLDVKHNTWSSECPMYKRKVNAERSKTMY